MALTNLSLVTSSLVTLLTERVKLWYPTVVVLPQSPDKLPNTTKNTLSLYLYHAREDAHYKNAQARGGSGTIERTPLSLSLYYVLTAHHYEDDDQTPDVLLEQKLMGYALKALHDFPIVNDSTQVGVTTILDEELREKDNSLQIIYRPVAPEESATFWNGDDERLVRFSAFYEVRVVLLEPEPIVQLPGYVLSVGNYVLPTGAMHIASTHSVVRFTPPGADEIAVPASPARAALKSDEVLGPLTPNNHLLLRGTRLGGGRLVLRSPLFDTPNNQVILDPALNPDWEIHVTPTQVTARIQNNVVLPGPITKDVLPGTYGVSVQVSTVYPLPGSQSKTLTTRSNEWAISFTPFVEEHTTVTDPVPASVTVTTASDTDLTDSALDGEIEVFVAGQMYSRVTGAPDLKEFKVDTSDTIILGAHFGVGDAGAYPLRLIIRGAEAPPFWIEVPA
jgi:hypothetical protein